MLLLLPFVLSCFLGYGLLSRVFWSLVALFFFYLHLLAISCLYSHSLTHSFFYHLRLHRHWQHIHSDTELNARPTERIGLKYSYLDGTYFHFQPGYHMHICTKTTSRLESSFYSSKSFVCFGFSSVLRLLLFSVFQLSWFMIFFYHVYCSRCTLRSCLCITWIACAITVYWIHLQMHKH